MDKLNLAIKAAVFAICNSRFGKQGGVFVHGFEENPEEIGYRDAARILAEAESENNIFLCPVKPGQTVYVPYCSIIAKDRKGIRQEEIECVTLGEGYWYAPFKNGFGAADGYNWLVGVFPTREEAEAALKKRLEEEQE